MQQKLSGSTFVWTLFGIAGYCFIAFIHIVMGVPWFLCCIYVFAVVYNSSTLI